MSEKPSADEIARDLVVAWLAAEPRVWKAGKPSDVGDAIGVVYERALAKVRAALAAK